MKITDYKTLFIMPVDSIMARGCICCVKYMLFLFNLLFWLGGCGLLGVGVWLSVSQGSFATLSPSFPSLSAANLIITLGIVVMVTGFLGCLGAIKENKCLLLSFFIVLLIILLAELILLILFFVYTDKVSENAKQDLKEGLVLYNTDNNAGLREAWDTIQKEWSCCGVMNHNDWYAALHNHAFLTTAAGSIPPAGCYEKVEEWLDDNKHLLGTIAMCVLVIQICFNYTDNSRVTIRSARVHGLVIVMDDVALDDDEADELLVSSQLSFCSI
ncbi:hypothetical protein INR49_004933 [Caranx melampygus]|nr:hypothetical protein INR49_004933 [Caranx melampygus]